LPETVAVHRQDGFRLVIYLDDHEPPHVHVYASGAEAKIGLLAQDGRPYVIRAFAMRAGDLRKAVQLVSEQQAMLVAKWREIHG
jgi:Domain of unknown function (DUF4160)